MRAKGVHGWLSRFPEEVERTGQEHRGASSLTHGPGTGFTRVLEMVCRPRTHPSGQCRPVQIRELVGMEATRKAVIGPHAKDPLTFFRREADPFAERVDGISEAALGHIRDHLVAYEVHVRSSVLHEFRGQRMGPEKRGRHGYARIGEHAGRLEHAEFRGQIQAVARLDLDRGRSEIDHVLEPASRTFHQVLEGSGTRRPNGGQDASSSPCDLLVAGSPETLLPLRCARPPENQMRVTVDQPRRHPAALEVDRIGRRRNGPLGRGCGFPDPFHPTIPHEDHDVVHGAVVTLSGLGHRCCVSVVQRQIRCAQGPPSFDVGFQANLHSTTMSDLFFDSALLPTGWAHDVRIGVDSGGWISSVESETTPRGARHVPGIAVPGVPNVHSHAFQRAMAGLTEHGSPMGDSFWSWRQRMYGFLRTLDPPAVEAIAAQLFVELLRRGFTSVTEFHYLRNDRDGSPYADPVEMARRVLHAAEDTGIGLTILPTLYTASDFGGEPPEHEQRRFVSSVEALIGDIAVLGAGASAGTVRVGLALHSLRAVPPDALSIAVDAARGMDPSLPIHIHVAEQEREVERCLEWSGARPTAWLLDHAPVDRHWCLIHATHVDPDEIARMAGSEAVVGLCPTTEANLGDGIFPLQTYQESRGRWAIGTDSHVGRGPAGELRMLEYGQRLQTRTRNVAAGPHHRSSARTLLEAALSGGAAACGRRIGALSSGARADIVVLDPHHDALVGRSGDDALDSWIFSGDDTPVRDVFTGGHQVVHDGRHPSQDRVRERYAAVIRELSEETPQLAIDFE